MMFFVFFIGGIFSNFLDMPVFTYISIFLPIAATIGIISLFFGYFALLALTFAAAGAVHGFIYLLKGGGGFLQTYKALAYSSGITLLFWPTVLLIYFLPQELASMVFLGGFVVVSAALFVAFVKGLSRLHQISLPKVLASASLPLLIAVALVIMFLPSLLALSLFNEDSSGLATGFQGFDVSDWSYDYQGNFYMVFKNSNGNPVTLNTVTADCGIDRSPVVLVTSDPTHLESGASITYTTGENKCTGKEPGEDYAISATIRYLNENNMIAYSSSGTVLGTIPTA
jgi:hypothetical protein